MTVPLFTAQLPTALYTAAQVRELDRLTIASGVPGFQLMTCAGKAAFALLQSAWSSAKSIVVLCGNGNNGGDGYIVAALARQHGMLVQVLAVASPERLVGDAKRAWAFAREVGVDIRPFTDSAPFEASVLSSAEVIVDAVLGTGLQGEVRAESRMVIEWINASGKPVLAIDIPSGLCADSGRVLGDAVKASVTLTFIGMKTGLLLGNARQYVGQLYFAGLDVPVILRDTVPVSLTHVDSSWVNTLLPPRARDAHKGHFGHVLVVGGDLGMGGAALMAAEAAARAGAGLVSVATRGEHLSALLARRPELMVHPVAEHDSIQRLIDAASVIVIGPGLGRNQWGENVFRQVLASAKPMVIDADGLNRLAVEKLPSNARPQWVLTPHPGEAARLLQVDTHAVQNDRANAARGLQARYGGVVVLKGAGTLVCNQNQHLSLSTTGNPGMATGGMGDVLSGIIGGLLAQGVGAADAATAAVWLHGMAADYAASAGGERGLLATDLLAPLRRLVNPLN